MDKALKICMWGVAILLMALAGFVIIVALLPPEMIRGIL